MSGDRGRLIIRRVYVLRAALAGFLFGLIIGTFFIASSLYGIWSLSEARGLTPESITGGDLVFVGVVAVIGFAVLSLVAAFVAAFAYNLLARLGAGLHVDLEEKENALSLASSV